MGSATDRLAVFAPNCVVPAPPTAGSRTVNVSREQPARTTVRSRVFQKITDDGLWSLYFHTVLLTTLDEREYIIQS